MGGRKKGGEEEEETGGREEGKEERGEMCSPNNLQLLPQQNTFHCHPNSRRSVPTVRPPRSVRKVHASMSPQSVLRVRPQVRPRQNTSSALPTDSPHLHLHFDFVVGAVAIAQIFCAVVRAPRRDAHRD